ncbi:MAG TPA: class I SAM-dependent methyltransferase [Saprospiraceae bacterium]|nr:class I SAM-dependent methyltransferase [Saprospiraceae bacterium]
MEQKESSYLNKAYAIEGGLAGRVRLDVLSRVMNPYSIQRLQNLDIQPGMHCLDAGCGNGSMTFEIAEMVKERGMVIGLDLDPVLIEENQKLAQSFGKTHIQFIQGNISDLSDHQLFDVIYSRFLLSHLKDPQETLRIMYTALKPGGMILIEDIQFSGHFSYPDHDAFKIYQEWYKTVVDLRGGDAELGSRLHEIICLAGFELHDVSIVQPAGYNNLAKQIGLITLERIENALLIHKITTKEKFDSIRSELKAFTDSAHTLIALPRIFQVSAIK